MVISLAGAVAAVAGAVVLAAAAAGFAVAGFFTAILRQYGDCNLPVLSLGSFGAIQSQALFPPQPFSSKPLQIETAATFLGAAGLAAAGAAAVAAAGAAGFAAAGAALATGAAAAGAGLAAAGAVVVAAGSAKAEAANIPHATEVRSAPALLVNLDVTAGSPTIGFRFESYHVHFGQKHGRGMNFHPFAAKYHLSSECFAVRTAHPACDWPPKAKSACLPCTNAP